MKDNFKLWLKCAGIRAIKTFCQTALALIPVDVMITQVDWKIVLLTALNSALISLLTSVAGLPEMESNYKGNYISDTVGGENEEESD